MDKSISSPVSIAGIKLSNKLMNGAYIGSKTLDDVNNLANSKCGTIVVGSISLKPRKENPGKGYWAHKEHFYSLNSYGMPNGGLPYYNKNLKAMTKIAHDAGKSLIANVVGFSNEEFIELILLAQDSGADMVELNFSCPNVWEGGLQEQIISYHASLIKDVLMFIKKAAPTIPICVKISPLPPDTLKEVAKVIVDSKIVKAITATNSYPNASTSTGTTTENEVVLGGLTGRSLKPISLGVVKQLRSLLPEHIDIIGCGGISSLNDVEDYLNTGAKAIQIATGILDNGTEIFEKILFPLI